MSERREFTHGGYRITEEAPGPKGWYVIRDENGSLVFAAHTLRGAKMVANNDRKRRAREAAR